MHFLRHIFKLHYIPKNCEIAAPQFCQEHTCGRCYLDELLEVLQELGFVSLFKKKQTRLHTRNAYQATFYKHPFHSLPSLQPPSPLSSKNLVLPVWLLLLSSYGIRFVDLPNLTVSSGRFRERCKGLKQLMEVGNSQ